MTTGTLSWPVVGAVLAVLVLITVAVARLGGLGVERPAAVAATRAVVQLAAVSLVIAAVLDSGWGTAGFVLLMYTVASFTAARRVTHEWSGLWFGLAIAGGVAPVLALLLASGLVPAEPVAVVPTAGILIGGAMTATGLAGRRAVDELRDRHGEYEAYLSLGFLVSTARREVCRPAATQALSPILDQTRTVGLVTLPGAYVGLLLGGASPIQAGVTQALVLIGLLAVEVVAVLVAVELVVRR